MSAYTTEEKKKLIKRYSHSILSLHCPRNIHKVMAREPVEVLPAEETEEGRQMHHLLSQILLQPPEERNFRRLRDVGNVYGDCTNQFNLLVGKIETERKIRIKLGKYTFTVVLDVLVKRRKEIDIIDHKTTYASQISKVYLAQLEEYSLPWLRHGFRVRLGIHLVRWGRIEWVGIVEGLDDYAQISNRVIRRIQEIEEIIKDKPVPIPNSFECTYCNWPRTCPEAQKMFVTNNEEAAQMAREYIKTKSKLKALEKFLKIYCERVGNIYLGDSVLGFNPSNEKIIDELGLLEFLEKHNIHITEAFGAQSSKIDKLARRYEDIANFIEIGVKPKWAFKKMTPAEQELESQVRRFVIIDEEAQKEGLERAKAELEAYAKKHPEIQRFVDFGDVGEEE